MSTKIEDKDRKRSWKQNLMNFKAAFKKVRLLIRKDRQKPTMNWEFRNRLSNHELLSFIVLRWKNFTKGALGLPKPSQKTCQANTATNHDAEHKSNMAIIPTQPLSGRQPPILFHPLIGCNTLYVQHFSMIVQLGFSTLAHSSALGSASACNGQVTNPEAHHRPHYVSNARDPLKQSTNWKIRTRSKAWVSPNFLGLKINPKFKASLYGLPKSQIWKQNTRSWLYRDFWEP